MSSPLVGREAHLVACHIDPLTVFTDTVTAPEDMTAKVAAVPLPVTGHIISKGVALNAAICRDLNGDTEPLQIAILYERQKSVFVFNTLEAFRHGGQGDGRENGSQGNGT